jgi:hypothetical protein
MQRPKERIASVDIQPIKRFEDGRLPKEQQKNVKSYSFKVLTFPFPLVILAILRASPSSFCHSRASLRLIS